MISGNTRFFGEDQKMKSSSKSSSTGICVGKKTKVIWTKDLHKKFLEAIGKLGIDNAVPKKIVELMKVDGLTRDQVASHLQKYRILSKKIASTSNCVQSTLKPSLLESSMTNGASWSHSSLMFNQEQINWPSYSGMHVVSPLILDTSSSYFHVLDASNFNSINKGYSMQEMTKNLDQVINLVNSSNSGVVQNLDGYINDYGCCSTKVQNYNNFEMGSCGGVLYSSNSSSMQKNPSGFNSNFFENSFGEDDLKLNEVDIAYLLSYGDGNHLPANLESVNKDVTGQNIANDASFSSYYSEEPISVNQNQSLDGYVTGFNPLFKEHMDERFMEPIWSPELHVDDMILPSQILNSYVQT
ncbi:hypothetical protein R6Q57_013238 [Mikania cordata]